LVGVPWCLNVGRLFYRRDLLEKYDLAVPRTWLELETSARTVQQGERAAGHSEFSGYVFQGRASEELTVDAVEWFESYGAPGIVAADGAVVVDDPLDQAALARAVTWLGSIAPLSVLNMGSSESLRFFMDGNAAFLRYRSDGFAHTGEATSLVRGLIGMADLPTRSSERHHPAVIAGFGLAVSRYSKVPELASNLVAWLTGAAEEKRRALTAGFDPSRPELYEDPDLVARYPFFPALRLTLSAATSGPSRITGRKYDEVSAVLSGAVHRALTRQENPSVALGEAAATLRGMSSSWRE
jgi:trehalose/maltose transport system substrate-binding protein